MKTVLITGSNGFIGKNLVSLLESRYHVITYDRFDTRTSLDQGIQECDFIFHLAGAIRPENESEYKSSNIELIKYIMDKVTEYGGKIPILFTSSIQIQTESEYGRTKLAGEELLINWAREQKTKVFIYRLPPVFGKWCKPNYNSVVATFCYNIAHSIPIEVRDPEHIHEMVYIDDVMEEFEACLKQEEERQTGYYEVNPVYRIKLQDLAERLYSFKQIPSKLVLPDVSDLLTKKLYSTYLSYNESEIWESLLQTKADERGILCEILKGNSWGQIFVSTTNPGVVRGNHWHHTKIEKFIVVQGKAEIALRQYYSEKIIRYQVSGDRFEVIDIPPGYTHSIRNIGSDLLITIIWANEIFNSEHTDTYYCKVE